MIIESDSDELCQITTRYSQLKRQSLVNQINVDRVIEEDRSEDDNPRLSRLQKLQQARIVSAQPERTKKTEYVVRSEFVPKSQANQVISRPIEFGISLDVGHAKPGFAKKQRRKPVDLTGIDVVEIVDENYSKPNGATHHSTLAMLQKPTNPVAVRQLITPT